MNSVHLNSLAGLGDRWEQSVRQRFGREANTYIAPDRFEQSRASELVALVSQVVRHDRPSLEALQGRAQQLGLELSELQTPRQSFVLLQEGEPQKGWGQLLFRVPSLTEATRPDTVLVEVPHPVFDAGTPELGMQIFERTGADVLLMAGAHRLNRPESSPEQPDRRLSDPAHSASTFFQAAHQALQGAHQTVLQVHGFAARSADDPQVVLSDGQDDQHCPHGLSQFQQQLDARGLRTGIVDFQQDWLTARSNLQGQTMAAADLLGPAGTSQFIHVEFEAGLRKGPDRQQSFAAIADAARDWLSP